MDIGIRTPPAAGKMGFDKFAEWAAEVGFAAIDVGRVDADNKKILDDNGLRLGTVDLQGAAAMLNPDEAVGKEWLESQRATLSQAAELGAKTLFTVLIPQNGAQPRRESHEHLKRHLPAFAALLEELDLHLAIEGWPGGSPHYPALGCTPESLRAIFAEVPSANLGICFDPSHLVRQGIDHVRFLWEFGSRVKHCHGKDTELIEEQQYLVGHHGSTFGGKYGYGDAAWRYCIPGEGECDWVELTARLFDVGYNNLICVELEDAYYFPEVEQQQLGMEKALGLLESCVDRLVR